MNVRNPKKRVFNTRNSPQNIAELPENNLTGNDSIPKQHVGASKASQLEFDPEIGRIFSPINKQTYFNDEDDFSIPFKTYTRIDEDPFDLLPETLFDNSLSEDSEQNQSGLNGKLPLLTIAEAFSINETTPSIKEQGEEQMEEQSESEHEESLSQDRSTTPTYYQIGKKPITNHPLTPLIEEWLSKEWGSIPACSNYKWSIRQFIDFLVDQNIQNPNPEHIILYHKSLIANPKIKVPNYYLSAVRAFFRWTEEKGKYKNITIYADNQTCERRKYPKITTKQRNNGQNISNIRNQPKATVTASDLRYAGFPYNKYKYIINNDLKVFKQWIETLNVTNTITTEKIAILKFAHFLHSENRTTPTQQDIIDYYKILSKLSPSRVNRILLTIRHFFEWTDRHNIYPDITTNIYSAKRKPLNADDIPILPPEHEMQPILDPTRPLINKTI